MRSTMSLSGTSVVCGPGQLPQQTWYRMRSAGSAAIGTALKRIGPRLDRAAFEAAQAFQRVLRPADRFSEFPVADHVDADLGLAVNDGGDGFAQTLLVRFPVERLAPLLGAQKSLQRLRPDQAADMRGEDAIGAAFHCA